MVLKNTQFVTLEKCKINQKIMLCLIKKIFLNIKPYNIYTFSHLLRSELRKCVKQLVYSFLIFIVLFLILLQRFVLVFKILPGGHSLGLFNNNFLSLISFFIFIVLVLILLQRPVI